MSKMKSLAALTIIAAMMGEGLTDGRSRLSPDDIDTTPKEPPKPKGMNQYRFYGVEVWAINEKNARKKAAKLAGIS